MEVPILAEKVWSANADFLPLPMGFRDVSALIKRPKALWSQNANFGRRCQRRKDARVLNLLDGPGTRFRTDAHTISGYFGRISPEIPTRDKGLLGFRLLKGLTALIFGSLRIFYALMPPARQVKCRFCDRKFSKKSNLHRHWMLDSCSNNPNPRNLCPRCPHCDLQFANKPSFDLHLSRNRCRVLRQQQQLQQIQAQPYAQPQPQPQPQQPVNQMPNHGDQNESDDE